MMKLTKILATGFLLISVNLGWAAGGGGSSSSSSSSAPAPVPGDITQLIEEENFERAVMELRSFVRKEKRNADAWNWLGYSQRKTGDLKNSLKSYKKALRLDKRHLGANEYLGELYVMQGKLKKANKQLKRLAKYCGDCEEFQDLKEMISSNGG